MRRQHSCATLVLVLLAVSVPAAGLDALSGDGWHTWRVAAVGQVGDLCCYDWNAGNATRKACDLDQHRGGYETANTPAAAPETMQIYALLDGDKPIRVHTFSASCPVSSSGDLNDLGRVDETDSVAWLQKQVSGEPGLNGQLLAAISVHHGDYSRDVLVRFAEQHESLQTRKDSLFWLGQFRGVETKSTLERIANDDPDSGVRQHALFILSQLPNEAGIDSLIAVVGNRESPHDDRKNALFWLAQSNSDRALEFLAGLLSAD